ncbi:MAG: hypothetical protein ACFFD1_01020 [Candidatus Thorarchaeota archaeon]
MTDTHDHLNSLVQPPLSMGSDSVGEPERIEIPETAIVIDRKRQAGPAYIDLDGERVQQQGLNLLVAGYRGSGKSYALWYLCEELWRLRVPFTVLDPAGTGRGLLELPDGLSAWDGNFEGFMGRFIYGGQSYYANLSRLPVEAAPQLLIRWISQYLEYVQLNEPFTVALVLDDLARFAPGKGASDEFKQAGADLAYLIQEARRFGLFVLSTVQRLDLTMSQITQQMNLWFFGNPGSTSDFKKSLAHLPAWFEESQWNQRMLSSLPAGRFLMMSQAGGGLVQIPKRRTTDYGAAPAALRRPGGRKEPRR